MLGDHPVRITAGIVVAMVVFAAFWGAIPAWQTPAGEETTQLQLRDLEPAGNELDAQVPPGKKVFSITVNFYAFSNRWHPYTSRVWYVVSPFRGVRQGFDETRRADRIRRNLTRMFHSGEVAFVVATPRTAYFIRNWLSLYLEFRGHFCRVTPTPGFYAEFNVYVYRWYAEQPEGCVSRMSVEWASAPSLSDV